ncbi:hypothetical protein ACFVIM_10075 [Streptomyces sp. NPDC057638]|uniref:hypothetical protein n=1 Tax=Streptomyces sp. NPDC057638 TaxID=3346190 RepID=UPI0036AA7331
MLRNLSSEGTCKNGSCPTLWGTEDAERYVVQGRIVTDPAWLAQLGLPEGETAVLVPAEVLEGYFRDHR